MNHHIQHYTHGDSPPAIPTTRGANQLDYIKVDPFEEIKLYSNSYCHFPCMIFGGQFLMMTRLLRLTNIMMTRDSPDYI
jgi:hypothetical protein